MALTYQDQSAMVADTPFVDRVYACVADVAQSQIRSLVNTAPNYTALIRISVDAVKDKDTWGPTFARLVAASLPGTVNIATPVVDTATDAQIRTQVRNAFDALVTN